jgi:hypothetical protein
MMGEYLEIIPIERQIIIAFCFGEISSSAVLENSARGLSQQSISGHM